MVTHLEREAARAAAANEPPPPTVLVGESFGGLLALGVLLSLGKCVIYNLIYTYKLYACMHTCCRWVRVYFIHIYKLYAHGYV